MKKVFKYFVWAISTMLVILVLLAIIASKFIDLNKHKTWITGIVKEKTGRELTIKGDIDLSFLPWLGIQLNDLTLSNHANFEEPYFAKVDHMQVGIKLIPLVLEQKIKAGVITVDGLGLHLAKSKSGITNWSDLVPTYTGDEEKDQQKKEKTKKGLSLFAFEAEGIEVSDARIFWNDMNTNVRYQLEKLNAETGPLNAKKPIDLKTDWILSINQPSLKAKTNLVTQVLPDFETMQFEFKQSKLDIKITSQESQAQTLSVSLETDIQADLSNGLIKSNNLSIKSKDLIIDGNITVDHLFEKEPRINSSIVVHPFNPRTWLDILQIKLPTMSDDNALKKTALSATIKANQSQIDLKNIKINVDDTQIKGTASIAQPLKDPKIKFDMIINSIDLNRYLPPESEQDQQSTEKNDPEINMPVGLLKHHVQGKIKINQLAVKKISANDIQLKIDSKNSLSQLSHQIGRIYGGMAQGTLSINTKQEPIIRITENLSNMDIGNVLRDFADIDLLESKGNLNAAIQTKGVRLSTLKKNLNGHLKFKFDNGSIKGYNVARMMRDAKNKLRSRKNSNETDGLKKTDFVELTGTAVINNGVLKNQDLSAKSPFLRLSGSGQTSIVEETIDYTVRPVIVNTSKGQEGADLSDLQGIPIPIRITGTWQGPKWDIKLGQEIKAQVKKLKKRAKEKLSIEEDKLREKLSHQKEEAEEDLKNKAKERLAKELKKLF